MAFFISHTLYMCVVFSRRRQFIVAARMHNVWGIYSYCHGLFDICIMANYDNNGENFLHRYYCQHNVKYSSNACQVYRLAEHTHTAQTVLYK